MYYTGRQVQNDLWKLLYHIVTNFLQKKKKQKKKKQKKK